MPQSITTKLKPQMVATRAASSESRRDMRAILRRGTIKHQRIVMALTM
jgi:hypothetical protein